MPRSRLPLISLLAFEATARLGKQSAAADELGVTNGAISRHIRNLEMQLDTPLMAGSRRDPGLTVAARKLAQALTPAFNSIDEAFGLISRDKIAILDVACLSSFALRWLIPRLNQFHLLHANIDVRLSTKEPVANFQSRHCDVAILVTDPATRVQSGDKHLFDEMMTVVVSPKLLQNTALQSPAEINALARLTTATRPNAWPIWDASQLNNPVMTTVSSRQFEHYTFAIEAAANGLGACAVPHHLVMDDLASGRLVSPFDPVATGYRYFARHRNSRNAASDIFCDWLQTECLLTFGATQQKAAFGSA